MAVAALMRALQARTADLRYGVACAGMLFMAICPLVTTVWCLEARRAETLVRGNVVAAFPARAAEPATAGTGSSGGEGGFAAVVSPRPAEARLATRAAWLARVESWLPAVVTGWLLGICVMALRLVKGFVAVRSLTRQGITSPTGEIQAMIGSLANRAGLGRPIGCFLSFLVEVPTIVGWIRPKILIPVNSLARITLGQLEMLLAHKIAHIRRHDYLVNILQIVVESLLFFHPAVWWVSRRIRMERENCCDDMAVRLCGGDRVLLARALFAMEEQRSTPILRIAAAGGSLRERIRRLVVPTPETSCVESGWTGVCLIVACGVIAVSLLAAGSPRMRGDAPPDGKASVTGRVLDQAGQPIAGARVRLYRREGRWEHRHPMIEDATTGLDGSFLLRSRLELLPLSRSRGLEPYVIVADHAGKAVGWRTIPNQATEFAGDVILTEPSERVLTVVDADDRPVAGAKCQPAGWAMRPRRHPI